MSKGHLIQSPLFRSSEEIKPRLRDSPSQMLNEIDDDDVSVDDRGLRCHMDVLRLREINATAAITKPPVSAVWDDEWHHQENGCVDLWIKWSSDTESLEVDLEHWSIRQLASRAEHGPSIGSVDAALSGPGDIEARIDVIAQVLETAMADTIR